MRKRILIIEPGFSLLALLPAAKELDLEVVVFSADKEDRIIPQHYRTYINEFYVLETNDKNLLIQEANKLKNINAVIPGSEYHVPMAAFVASKLNLPHIPVESVNNLRNKFSIREALAKTNLRSVKYIKLNKLDESINKLNFPVVVKPVAAAGSAFVKKCENIHEVKSHFNLIKQSSWGEMGHFINGAVLIEEYVGGNEYSVEGFVTHENICIVSITEKFKNAEPYFVEMGHIVEAELDDQTKNSITNYIEKIIPALGINLGVFHAEIKLDDQGPVLIEIAGRLPGDRIVDLIKLAKNIDLAKIMIQAHLGEAVKLEKNSEDTHAFIHYFALEKEGAYKSIEGLNELKKIPGFKEFKICIQPGISIPKLTSFEERVAYVIFTANSYAEAKLKIKRAAQLLRFCN